MDQKVRKVHSPEFKAKVALEAIKEKKTIAELAGMYSVHTTQITKWKKKALEGLGEIFSDQKQQRKKDTDDLIQELYNQIGRLKVEVDFLKKKMGIFEQ